MSGTGYAPEGELLVRPATKCSRPAVYRVACRNRPDFPGNVFHQDLFRGSPDSGEPAFHKIDTPMTPARIEAV
jgi:hypothetical protein